MCGLTLDRVLRGMDAPEDFVSGARFRSIHRRTDSADIYFVANSLPTPVETSCTFRVAGRSPEVWWPDTGRMECATMYTAGADRTTVRLTLEANGSVFVIFREQAATPSVRAVAQDGKALLAIDDPTAAVVVTKAVYGVSGDASLVRDVKGRGPTGGVDAGRNSVARGYRGGRRRSRAWPGQDAHGRIPGGREDFFGEGRRRGYGALDR